MARFVFRSSSIAAAVAAPVAAAKEQPRELSWLPTISYSVPFVSLSGPKARANNKRLLLSKLCGLRTSQVGWE